MNKPFATEVELCATFIETVDKRVWTPYAETQGWDILLVRKIDGFQIGVQAKLTLNLDVINQAIEEFAHYPKHGPDSRAVLVPEGGTGRLKNICDYLGLVIITAYAKGYSYKHATFSPALPQTPQAFDHDRWHEWAPMRRHKLPEFVPDVAAGSSAPVQLTDWKIRAMRVAIVLQKNGRVHRTDFDHLKVDPRRWIANEWIKASTNGYVAGGMPNFKKQHPKVWAQIEAKFDEWKPIGGGTLL